MVYTPSSSKAPKKIELKALAVIQPRGFESILLGAFELEGVYSFGGRESGEAIEAVAKLPASGKKPFVLRIYSRISCRMKN